MAENWTIIIDNDMVDRETVEKAYRFWKTYHITGGEMSCPLCGCDLSENEKAVCDSCLEICYTDEMCYAHGDDDKFVCKDCCEECRKEREINAKINEMRDK